MIVIYPPLVRNTEPPPALARMAACLKARGIACQMIDANSEVFSLLCAGDTGNGEQVLAANTDTWTRRAFRNREQTVTALSSPAGYASFASYVRLTHNLSRLVSRSPLAGVGSGMTGRFGLSLTDYQDADLSPLSSADLARAFEYHQDSPFYGYFSKRLPEALDSSSAGSGLCWLGFSLGYLSQVLPAFAMAGFVRQNYPQVKMVLGGPLLNSWIDNPAFIKLCRDLDLLPWRGSAEAFSDSYLLPEAALSPAIEPGHDYDFSRDRLYFAPGCILPLAASSGCRYRRCRFCSETWEGSEYCASATASVLEQATALCQRHNPALVHFCDNEMSPDLLHALARSADNGEPPFGHPDTGWYGFARVSSDLADADFCRSLAASGCRMLCLGIESGSPKVLEQMRKGIRLSLISRVLRNLKASGIATYCYFLFGTPAESAEEAAETVDLMREHAACISFCNLSIFNLSLKSPEALELETCAHYDADLSLYTGFEHPFGWNRNRVREFIKQEIRRDPVLSEILKRNPPFFTSSHAPFFVKN